MPLAEPPRAGPLSRCKSPRSANRQKRKRERISIEGEYVPSGQDAGGASGLWMTLRSRKKPSAPREQSNSVYCWQCPHVLGDCPLEAESLSQEEDSGTESSNSSFCLSSSTESPDVDTPPPTPDDAPPTGALESRARGYGTDPHTTRGAVEETRLGIAARLAGVQWRRPRGGVTSQPATVVPSSTQRIVQAGPDDGGGGAREDTTRDIMSSMKKDPATYEYLRELVDCDIRIATAMRDHFDLWPADISRPSEEEYNRFITTPHNLNMTLASIIVDLYKQGKSDAKAFIECLDKHVPIAVPITDALKAHLDGEPRTSVAELRPANAEIRAPAVAMHLRNIEAHDMHAYERMVLQLADPDVRAVVAIYYGKLMNLPLFEIVLAASYSRMFLKLWDAVLDAPVISFTCYLVDLASRHSAVMTALVKSGAAAALVEIDPSAHASFHGGDCGASGNRGTDVNIAASDDSPEIDMDADNILLGDWLTRDVYGDLSTYNLFF